MSIAKTTSKKQGIGKLIHFTLSGDNYVIDNITVLQIIQNPSITPVANSEQYFLGSTVYHGSILPVIDLQAFLYDNDLVKIESSFNGQKNFMVVENKGKQAIFLVENVLGIIEKPESSQFSDFLKLTGIKESIFFDKAFLWYNKIVVQIRVARIFEEIINELKNNGTNYLSKHKTSLTPISMTESLKEYNIDLQHKNRTTIPTSSFGNASFIRTPQKTKFTGTVVSVQGLTILVPNDQLVNIFNVSHITEIPNSPKEVMGTINYHGDVINTLNLANLLSEDDQDYKDRKFNDRRKTEVLILEINNQKIALFVDNISKILEIDENEIRETLVLNDGIKIDYIFKGAILEKSGQIILVLDVNYLFKRYFSFEEINEYESHVICFENPENYSYHHVHESGQEGLLFQDEENYYFINSESISQVLAHDSFLMKDYGHSAIKGAAIHTDINPLIDFTYLLSGEEAKKRNGEKKVGILVQDPESGREFTLLVEKVLGKISIDQFDVYQEDTNFSSSLASSIISGFFTFNEKLGIIINPSRLGEEVLLILSESTESKNMEKDFISSLLPSELNILETIQTERKEWESLLFSSQEGVRLDYLVFKWKELRFALDVSLIQRVYSSTSQSKIVDPSYHPLIGIGKVEAEEYPILDLCSLILQDQFHTDIMKEMSFFSILSDKQCFLIPVDRLEGVISSFKEDIVPCDDFSIFLKKEECCRNYLSYNDDSSQAYIIENDFMMDLLVQNKKNKLLKELNIEKKKNEE
jgi:purine-binding chemotaxis protein CheW